jgi:hydrogenase small subunit
VRAASSATRNSGAQKEPKVCPPNPGLSCDGDSVSVTAATQPSIEDVILGAIPGLPKVHLHNPVLAYETGDDFLEVLVLGRSGKAGALRPGCRRVHPNEKIKREGYWAALGTDHRTGQPITTNEWIDRLAPKALAVVGAGTCATYGGIHAMEGNPTGCMGLADYLGWDWKSKAGICRSSTFRAARCSRITSWRRCSTCCIRCGLGAHDSARRSTAAYLAVRQTVHEGCDRAGYYEQGDFAEEYGSPNAS